MKLILSLGMMLLLAAPAFGQAGSITLDTSAYPPSSSTLGNFTLPPGQSVHNALRHEIEAIEAGQPDYAALTSDAAAHLRSQIQPIESDIRKWGALNMLSYQYSLDGWWVYEAHFDHAKVAWYIRPMDDHGKITGISFNKLASVS